LELSLFVRGDEPPAAPGETQARGFADAQDLQEFGVEPQFRRVHQLDDSQNA
jgi:hypothetical protein